MLPSFNHTEPKFITKLKKHLPKNWSYDQHVIDYNNSIGHVLSIWLRRTTNDGYDIQHCIKCDTSNASSYGYDSEAMYIDVVLTAVKTIESNFTPAVTSGNGKIPLSANPHTTNSAYLTGPKKYKKTIMFEDTLNLFDGKKENNLLLLL